jgi:hypothetical protein
VLPARLVLGDHVVKGLTLGGGGLADLPCADAPDDVRCEDARFQEAAGGGMLSTGASLEGEVEKRQRLTR